MNEWGENPHSETLSGFDFCEFSKVSLARWWIAEGEQAKGKKGLLKCVHSGARRVPLPQLAQLVLNQRKQDWF